MNAQKFGGLERKMALEVATEFFDFVAAHHLTSTLQDCDAQHMTTLAVHHAHCLVTSPKPIGVSVNSQYILSRGIYVPAAAVESPSPPHFVMAADASLGAPEHATCRIEAPRVCQLCGRGFLNWKALFNHAKDAHHSFAEYRKRIFWEAENMDALPLPHSRKKDDAVEFRFSANPFDSRWG